MSESWYYVDSGGSVGPVTTLELRETLRALPDWKDVLVWSADFSDWKKASEVSEIRTRLATPPPVPTSHFSEQMPTWQVRWWWYLAALSFFGSAIQTVVIVKSFIELARFLLYLSGMREFGIIVIALVVLSATVRGHSHFVPRPTGPLPAVNVP